MRSLLALIGAAIFSTAGCIADDDVDTLDASITAEDAAGLDATVDPPDALADATAPGLDAGAPDAVALADSGPSDLGPPPGYGHVDPPAGAVPAVLTSSTWLTHYTQDLRPFWMMPAAFGTPEGNFPTYRTMTGNTQLPGTRYPRMIARQTYGYSMAYLMTGEPRLLELAHAGMQWLKLHARDPRGGCHAQLTATGDPIHQPKTAQDTAYCALGFAAYYFVTRDPEAEVELLALRDTLFDPATFWDAANSRIRDGRSADLATEHDVEGDSGWELVAQLDAINGFLLLAQPVMSTEMRRAQFLADMRTLSEAMIEHFYQDGIFWGVHNAKGRFRTKHVDFGHTLKTYWMLLQVDKRLPDHPFQHFVAANVHRMMDLAYDGPNGRWAKRPTSLTAVEYGSDWWIYAELDQLAATLDLAGGGRYLDERTQTQAHWLSDYVDRARPAREIIPGITRTGGPAFGWRDTDTAKANEWKSAFHSTEHALVLALAGHWAEDSEAVLHFAVPEADQATFIARPYVFDGTELGRTAGSTIAIGGEALREVRVRFGDLY